ncbi:MAG: phage holin family protein [Acetatifactor sp.]
MDRMREHFGKAVIKDVDNKRIPTIVTIVGAVPAVVINWGDVTLEAVVGGALSGLSSTGLHQLFKQWIDNGGAADK